MDRADAGIHGAEEGSRQHEALCQGSPLLCLLLIIFVVVVSHRDSFHLLQVPK